MGKNYKKLFQIVKIYLINLLLIFSPLHLQLVSSFEAVDLYGEDFREISQENLNKDGGKNHVSSLQFSLNKDENLIVNELLPHDSLENLLFEWEKPLCGYHTLFYIRKLDSRVPSDYVYNPHVPINIWEYLEPYFLPINHPIKHRLDRFFRKRRVTLSRETFEAAGFKEPKIRGPFNIVMGRHDYFSDYIIKVFFDIQPLTDEWINWVKRIEGARSIQECILRHGFSHFSVPRKWIYPLPEEPSPPLSPEYYRKNFILIAEDMRILNKKENLKAFKNRITLEILEELYTILSEEGLIDSTLPTNIPFTKKGKIAFVDTEHHHSSIPVNYNKLTRFLSPSMQDYWQSLIERNNLP